MKPYLVILFILSNFVVFQFAANAKDEQPFTIGWGLQPTTLNPYPSKGLVANNTLARHIFEPLYMFDRKGQIIPLLVSTHVIEDPHTWRFTLKPETSFHDGTMLTAQTVVNNLQHVQQLPADNYHRQQLGEGLKFSVVDNRQFRIHTAKPEPDLLRHLTDIVIVSLQTLKTPPEKLTAKQLIGTGPYRFISHHQLQRFQFTAFDNYHGQPAHQQSVTALVETDQLKRIDGFADGRFDLIDLVRKTYVERIQQKRSEARFSFPTGTVLYTIHLNVLAESFADIRDPEGRPLKNNPLKDKRVREAVSKAIGRTQLVQDLFGGTGATTTAQLLPPGYPGHMPGLTPPPRDIKTARKLMQEAGYGRGFQLTLRDKHDRRYILEALVPMLAEIGIKAQVETLPPEVYFPKALAHEYPVSLFAYQGSGDIRFMINGLLLTGAEANASGYSNPELDKRFEQASREFDPSVRFRDYGYAMELGLRDYALIPLFLFNQGWAVRSGRVFNPTADAYTLAQRVRPDE